jgi:hypothetical protein
VVAVAGPVDAPRLLLRERLSFAGNDVRFVYHAAALGPPAEAPASVERALATISAGAASEIAGLARRLAAMGHAAAAAVVPAKRVPPAGLDAILASHALIHAAEGALHCTVLVDACERRGIRVIRARERDIAQQAAERLGVDAAGFLAHVAALGRGPPWGADQRRAAAAAWLALAADLPIGANHKPLA